ncbi:hypothetical protein [Pararhodospirillum oryzae]|uniref:Uncharacterized protein n=1 Tax=Pararhodospirillum oryzae TaxID=478448 RepID=A0A512H8S0_9PROT|nr:hypothetical protein [Pararhodospirillum oryzae]GEO81845.1 hypothetical protein ROR02_19760 [Pararhodospirillum oryzae]
MVMGFFRVEPFDNTTRAQEVLADWHGPVLLPLIKPETPGGYWLRSAEARRDLSFMTASDILIVYPGVDDIEEYLKLLDGLSDTFATRGWDIRRIYPDPAVLLYDPANGGRCLVIRLKNPSGEIADDVVTVRRSLERLIRALVSRGAAYDMMAAESSFAEWIYKIENAAPIMAAFTRKMVELGCHSVLDIALENTRNPPQDE